MKSKQQEDSIPQERDNVRTSRRKLLGALAAGGAAAGAGNIPGKWSQPVIETAVLPAHGIVTMGSLTDPCTVSASVTSPTITANVSGVVMGIPIGDDLAGITINISAQLQQNGFDKGAPGNTSTTTAADGTYNAAVVFGAGCNAGSPEPDPRPNGVVVTVSSPEIVGSATCSDNFAKDACGALA